jgi:Holliday junction DNA helicase RuvA
MITGIAGTLDALDNQAVIVTIGGISIRIIVPTSVLSTATKIGERIQLYTSLHVREDQLVMYGFLTIRDRDAFEMLLGVNGVGSKAALALLSAMNATILYTTIQRKDEARLAATPGIGKKLAARIVLELQKKVAEYTEELEIFSNGGTIQAIRQKDLLEVLKNLGFAEKEIYNALQALPFTSNNTSLEEDLTEVLQILSVRK